MFDKLIEQWVFDWHNNKLLFWLELIGTVSSITASILISFWPTIINLVWVFVFWMIGSLSLASAAYIRSIAWPMLLMVTYSIFNLIGLYNTL